MRWIAAPVVAVVLAFWGCAATQEPAAAVPGFTLDEILGKMPPRDSLEARWLSSALLSLGPGAIDQLCRDLDTAGSNRTAQVEFAIQNAALAVSKPGAEQDRADLVAALAGALERQPSDRAATFILARLQSIGRGESIAPASRFLTDPRLCEPAAQAMVAIREGADRAFLSALPDATGDCRITIIQSLGVLGSILALDALYAEAASEDPDIRRAAADALANIEALEAATTAVKPSAGTVGVPTGARPGGPEAVVSLLAPLEHSTDPGVIAAARRAFDAMPCESFAPQVAESLPRLTPLASVAMLDLLGRCGTAVPAAPVAAIATSRTGPVQVAAIRTLGAIGGESVQKDLADLVVSSTDERVVNAARRSLAAVCLRGADPETRADALLEAYHRGNADGRLALLPVIGRVGGTRALGVAASESRSARPEFREAAIRALSSWPSVAAYDTLLAIAQGKEKTNLRILALRGCVRMVEEASLTPTEAVRYHERTLASAWRLEEKRLVLGALANIRTAYALRVVAPYVSDDSLGLDAALVAGKISAGTDGSANSFGSSQTARAFIDAYVPARYRDRVDRALDLYPSMNKPPPGYRALFNGRDLQGWKGLVENPVARSKMTPAGLSAAQARADSIMHAHWSVADGVLVFDGKGESLCTEEDFEDFELLVDWKIERLGDSGIYLRGSPQVQIWDPAQWPEGSGGLYNNEKNPRKPLRCADRPIGEWNTFRIRMIGDRVTVLLNEVLVVDSVVLENYWDRTIPIFPSGQIELQSHHSPLAFRNIFIREIPRREALFSGSLFNGIDLSGWEVVGGTTESWGVADGVLFTSGDGGGWLSTAREYDNFELELDFRLPAAGNSGVFLRAPREGDPAYTGMEVQVLDDAAEEYSALRPWQYCGSIYGVVAAKRGAAGRANEWQHYRIVAQGPRVAVMLNGRQVVDADLTDHMDKESAHPGLKRRAGYIGLQCHGDRVEYRNITLKELDWRE